MLALIAALATTTTGPVLESNMPWWEKIRVTVDGQGKQQSCTYESSLSLLGAEKCDKGMAESVEVRGSPGHDGVFSRLTFERRFSPGAKLGPTRLQPGDELIGQQVLFLTIDADGSIANCRVLATSGKMRFSYGCTEAKAEQFRTQASASASAPPRQGFMTILAYGHQEQIA